MTDNQIDEMLERTETLRQAHDKRAIVRSYLTEKPKLDSAKDADAAGPWVHDNTAKWAELRPELSERVKLLAMMAATISAEHRQVGLPMAQIACMSANDAEQILAEVERRNKT